MQRSSFIAITLFVLVVITPTMGGSSSAPQALDSAAQQLWDSNWKLAQEHLSFDHLVKGLQSEESISIPGLAVKEALAVQQWIALKMLYQHARTQSRFAEYEDVLRQYLQKDQHPQNRALAQQLLGNCSWRLGKLAEAEKSWAELGYLTDWWVMGPFNNERGSAFESVTELERQYLQSPSPHHWQRQAVYPGKRHEVSWRPAPAKSRGGTLEIGQWLRPAEEAFCYLSTSVYSESDQAAVLLVGSSGSITIWHGQHEVVRTDVERPLRLDQQGAPLLLKKGWNSLLVKSGNTQGNWAVRLRLVNSKGEPLLCKTQSSYNGKHANNSAIQQAEIYTRIPQLIALAEDTALRALLQGWIAAENHRHDHHQHPDRKFYARALELAPESRLAQYLFGKTYTQSVNIAAQREENIWRRSMENIIAQDRLFDRARLELASYYLNRFQNTKVAGELLAPCLTRESVAPAALHLSESLKRMRFGSLARTRSEEVLAEQRNKYPMVNAKRQHAATLRIQGYWQQAHDELQEAIALDMPKRSTRRELERLLLSRGLLDQARLSYRFLLAAYPQSLRDRIDFATFEAACENWQAALAAIDEALLLCPEAEHAQALRGDYLLQLGRNQAALEAFTESLRLDPNQPRVREYVELLEAEDDGFESHARLATADIIATALAQKENENISHRVLVNNQVVRIQQDGTTLRFHQQLIKIINDQGVRGFDSYAIPYAFGEQWVKVIRARVHHPDGRIEDARLRNQAPQVRKGEYPVWSQSWVDLPPLTPGDVVEIEYSKEDLRQSFFGDYFGDSVAFASTVPVDLTRYQLMAPLNKPLYFHQRSMAITPTTHQNSKEQSWTWQLKNQAQIDAEPGMPPLSEQVPLLEISSFKDWQAFTLWYHHLIRKQFESSAEIRKKTLELTAGVNDRWQKIQAIYEFVVTDVRYIAWEFGIHGFKPYRAATIFTRRFGDCKDKATLICTMLAELGIEAYPVLINGTRNRPIEDLSLPLISHFNHCIAYIPDSGRGPLYVDGTAEFHAVDQLPMMDRGAQVLIVRGEQAELDQVQWNKPEEQRVLERSRVRIYSDGQALVSQINELSGDYAIAIRKNMEIAAQRKERIERMLGRRFPGTQVTQLESSDLADLGSPVRLEIEMAIPDFMETSGDGIKLPAIQDLFATLDSLGQHVGQQSRKQVLALGNPSASDLQLTIQLPPGYKAKVLPKSTVMNNDFIDFELTVSSKDSTLTITRKFALKTARILPEDYEQFKKNIEIIEQLNAERIILSQNKGVE